MKILVGNHINYVSEERELLLCMTEPDGYPEGFLRSRENFQKKSSPGEGIQSLLHRFDVVDKIIKEGRKALKKDMELIRKYFTYYPGSNLCLADVILQFQIWDWNETADTLESYVRSQSSQERNERFIGTSFENFTSDESENISEEPITLKRINNWLEQSPLAPEDKWEIFSSFISWEEHLGPVVDLMKKAEKVLKKTQTLWQPVIDDFHQYWEEQCRIRDVIGDISQIFHIDLSSDHQRDILLATSMINMNRISFSITDDTRPIPYDYYGIGIIFGNDIYLDSEGLNSENRQLESCLAFCKLLSDKSKLDILRSIKDHPAYGAQLSRQMNLTTATISYHMSALIQNSLVSIQRVENRIYYSVNKDEVKKILRAIENLLL